MPIYYSQTTHVMCDVVVQSCSGLIHVCGGIRGSLASNMCDPWGIHMFMCLVLGWRVGPCCGHMLFAKYKFGVWCDGSVLQCDGP